VAPVSNLQTTDVSSPCLQIAPLHSLWWWGLRIRTLHNQTSPHNVDSLASGNFVPLNSLTSIGASDSGVIGWQKCCDLGFLFAFLRGALHLLWLWTLRICTVQFIIRTSPDNVDSLIVEIFVP